MQFICNFQTKVLINSPYYRQKHKLAGLCNGQAHCEVGIENLITLGICFQEDGGRACGQLANAQLKTLRPKY